MLGLVLAGCKPGVGSRCDKGEARCVDTTRALVCQDGRYIETPCRGEAGCRLEVDRTACDIHRDRPGDACSTDEEGAGVCINDKSLLACHKGKYVSVADTILQPAVASVDTWRPWYAADSSAVIISPTT